MPNIVELLATAMAPARARADQYAQTLDEGLAALSDDTARLALCKAQEASWISRYELFCEAVDSGRLTPKPGGATAYDYMETLAVIASRKARYAPARVQA